MEANKILSADVLDLIFEGKNKEYGAYELRKTYNRRIGRALLITASVALLALLGSILASAMKDKNNKKVKMEEMTIQEVKQEEKKPEPPPPPPPPPPKQPDPPKVEMKQFTPPVIKKDEEVEKPPPPQEELKEVKIDVKDEEGVKDIGIQEVQKPPEELKPVIEEKKEDPDENKIFEKVEVEAKFPGGDSKWRQYLERTLNPSAPVDGGAPEGTYTVVIQFIVDKEGNISDVRPLTNHGYGMEEEAMRTIRKGPKWEPAIQNGRQVKAYRKQPITFQVQSE
jgi:periplasmic protein TonB